MVKCIKHPFLVALQSIVLCIPLSLLQTNHAGWAQPPEAKVKTLDAEVNTYAQQLKSQDVTTRVGAASALGKPILGNPGFANPSGSAEVAVHALIEILSKDQEREATVRACAAAALGRRSYNPTTTEDIKIVAQLAVPELIEALADLKEEAPVRARAANSIGEISRAIHARTKRPLGKLFDNRETINKAIYTLSAALSDSDVQVRVSSAYALGTMGSDASIAVPVLINLLKDQNQDIIVRAKAANALGNPDLKASSNSEAVNTLINALQEQKADKYFLRASAALALATIESDPAVANRVVPSLITALKDDNILVRSSAANALGLMSARLMEPMTTDVVSALIKVVEIQREDAQVRVDAVNALKKVVSAQKVAPSRTNILILKSILNDLRDKQDVRAGAAYALGNIAAEGKDVVPTLVEIVKDNGDNAQVRQYAAYALRDFFKEKAETNKQLLSFGNWNQLISNSEQTIKSLKDANFLEEANEIERYLEIFTLRRRSFILNWIQQSSWLMQIFGFALCIFIFSSFWSLILWLRPLWLLQINKFLDAIRNIELPGLLKETPKVTVQIFLNVTFFNFILYRPRVLNAWTLKYCDIVKTAFLEKDTVSNHHIYVPMSVRIKDKQIFNLTSSSEEIRRIFSRNPTYLVIQEEGGSGKTNLACQLAKWAMSKDRGDRFCEHIMLPILIEREIDLEDEQPFLQAISGQLRVLIGEAEPISKELLDQLLRQRRILVIVDRLSEMSEATRQKLKFGDPNSPVNALIITSRVEENLDHKTAIQPQRIDGPQLSQFMADYLTQKGKFDLSKGQEFFDACSRLSSMVGQRGSTALLVTLYAQQMIAAKDNNTQGDELPTNIPDLMRSYLNQVNSKVPKDKQRDNVEVYQNAREVAWECLKQTYQPTSARINDVQKALEALVEPSQVKDGQNSQKVVKESLKYLEKDLNLIKTVEYGDKINFTLNPLAEYLAALRLVQNCSNDEKKWNDFLGSFNYQDRKSENVEGFLLAMRDCCLVKQKSENIPISVVDEINRLIELNSKF